MDFLISKKVLPYCGSRFFARLAKVVVPGGAGGAMAPTDFGTSVKPISTKGDRLCPPKNTDTPGFSDLSMTLYYIANFISFFFFQVSTASKVDYVHTAYFIP